MAVEEGRVAWRMMLDPEKHLSALLSAALTLYLENAVKDAVTGHVEARDLDLESLQREGAPLRLLEKIVALLGPLFRDVAENEIANLKHRCLERSGRVKCFIDVSENTWPSQEEERRENQCNINKRNCKAHAGITKELAEARKQGGELHLRYRPQPTNCWKKLRKELAKPDF